MNSELACGCVSKLLHEVAIFRVKSYCKNFDSLIVDLLYLKDC